MSGLAERINDAEAWLETTALLDIVLEIKPISQYKCVFNHSDLVDVGDYRIDIEKRATEYGWSLSILMVIPAGYEPDFDDLILYWKQLARKCPYPTWDENVTKLEGKENILVFEIIIT